MVYRVDGCLVLRRVGQLFILFDGELGLYDALGLVASTAANLLEVLLDRPGDFVVEVVQVVAVLPGYPLVGDVDQGHSFLVGPNTLQVLHVGLEVPELVHRRVVVEVLVDGMRGRLAASHSGRHLKQHGKWSY